MSEGENPNPAEADKPAEAAQPAAEGAPAAPPAADAAAPPEEAKAEPVDEGPATHFNFEHKVFLIPGCRFVIAPDTSKPGFQVPLGALKGTMDLALLRHSFDVKSGTRDDKLLGIVAQSLKYVKEIRPGDSIPKELLDGSASWSVSDQHRAVARNRLMLQLASWVTGRETVVTDMEHLQQVVDDPQMKKNIQEGVRKMASELGIPDERREEVLERVDKLARELCYIEALRSRLNEIRLIPYKLREVEALFRRNKGLGQEIQQIVRLIRPPLNAYQNLFDQVDAQTGEILAAMRNLDNQIKYIRDSRDMLHQRFMTWDDMLPKWENLEIEADQEPVELIRETYRFAAQHFLQPTSWQLTVHSPQQLGQKVKEKSKIKIDGRGGKGRA